MSHLSRQKILLVAMASFCLYLAGCTSHPSNPNDPLEPMNRVIYKFNDKADRWVMKPVAQSYHDYTPDFFRAGVTNFFSNLNDINSALHFALQGEGRASLYNLSRFLLNSTWGVLGFIDITSGDEHRYSRTGLGDTLAAYGWKNSSYFVYPLMGPSTIRDATGVTGDIVFRENVIYSNPHDDAKILSMVINAINSREKLLGLEDTVEGAALDPYSYVRDGWLQMRAKELGIEPPRSNDEEDFDIDDLVE